LYISHEIIKRQGGKIWVESEEGKGSTFCFTLPLDYRMSLENKNKEG
jgi:signal transduction histidine kinase